MKNPKPAERKLYAVKGIKSKAEPKELPIVVQPPTKNTKKRWEPSDFEIMEEIGKGRYGTVFKAREKTSSKILALKEVTFDTITKNDCFDLIKTEIEVNTRLLHPNIARMYGFFASPDKLTMVLEYIPGGDLFTKFIQSGGYLTEPEAAFVLNQVIDALIYLRDRHVIHRDIKPENILLQKNSKNEIIQAKLCDFTWAAHCVNERRITVCGTLGYCAPEVASAIDYDNKVDVWSTGVLLYQILTGTLFVEGNNLEEIQQSMLTLKVVFPEKPVVSDQAKALVQKLLAKIPEDRPALEKIKIDSWLLINLAKYKASIEDKRSK